VADASLRDRVRRSVARAVLPPYEAFAERVLAAKGKGGALASAGHTSLSGALPVNTGGGLIGFGHPVGATGVKQPLEIFRQMKGRCGDYQLSSLPKIGMTMNMGGDDKTVVSLIMRSGS
jgi:acetyl-CoA acyltransferase